MHKIRLYPPPPQAWQRPIGWPRRRAQLRIPAGFAAGVRGLASPTKHRARIFDRDGGLIPNRRNLYGRGDVLRFELPPPSIEKPGIAERAMIGIRTWLNRGDLPLYRELGPENGTGYKEVADSLKCQKRSMVRVNGRGEVLVSCAGPVQRFRAVHGALMLSTHAHDIHQLSPPHPPAIPQAA